MTRVRECSLEGWGARLCYRCLDSSGQPPTFRVQTTLRARNSLDLDGLPWDSSLYTPPRITSTLGLSLCPSSGLQQGLCLQLPPGQLHPEDPQPLKPLMSKTEFIYPFPQTCSPPLSRLGCEPWSSWSRLTPITRSCPFLLANTSPACAFLSTPISPPWFRPRSSQVALMVKNLLANAGDIRDVGSIPGFGRSPGGGHSNPLQYSCLKNPMDRGAWQATVCGVVQSRTQLKRLSMHARISHPDN